MRYAFLVAVVAAALITWMDWDYTEPTALANAIAPEAQPPTPTMPSPFWYAPLWQQTAQHPKVTILRIDTPRVGDQLDDVVLEHYPMPVLRVEKNYDNMPIVKPDPKRYPMPVLVPELHSITDDPGPAPYNTPKVKVLVVPKIEAQP